MTDRSQDHSRSSAPTRTRYSRLGPIIIACLLILIVVIQWTASYTDHQISNIATAVLLLSIAAVSGIWWFRNIDEKTVRWAVPLACLAMVASGLLIYQPVGFTGELVPIFRYRFATPKQLQTASETTPKSANSAAEMELLITKYCSPGFLGPDRTGQFAHRIFSKDWATNPPQQIWKQAIGGGLAGFATAKLKPLDGPSIPIGITLEQRDSNEAVTCYNLDSGKLRWVVTHAAYHSHPLGDIGPRSTPSIAATGRVYAQGATGHVWCLDASTGEIVWERDLLDLVGIDQGQSEQAVTWGRAASPLLVDDMVILPLGGSEQTSAGIKTLIAFDAATGEERWRGGKYQISYASPVLATLEGVRQIVSVNQDFVSGHDPQTGEELWSHSWPGVSNGGASCSNPITVDESHVLLSKGYGGGGMLLEVKRSDEGFSAAEVWSDIRVLKTKFTNPIVVADFVYGLSDGTLECVSVRDGQQRWKQNRSTRFGHGHILVVEDVMVGSTEDGEVVLVDLDSEQYEELGRFSAVSGKTWNPPAMIDNKVLIRNGNEMSLWDLGDRPQNAKEDSLQKPAAGNDAEV